MTPAAVARVYFQASLVAERQGQWVLARKYAEQAKAQYEEIADRATVGRVLNNLGGLNFLLGKPEEAIEQLNESFKVLLEYGSEADAARAVSSLAQVHLRTGQRRARGGAGAPGAQAPRRPRRRDRRDRECPASCSGVPCSSRAGSTKRRRPSTPPSSSFDQLSSISHRASAWIAKGDLAARRGQDQLAAQLYRRAAEALQDFRF